jgi:hypothetical protein
MTSKYLLKRRNRFGRYAHLTTVDSPPSDEWILERFGPGTYEINQAEEGVVGQNRLREVNIPWKLDYVDVVNGQPTLEYLREKHGVGNYITITGGRATAQQVFPEGTQHDLTYEMLQDGAPVVSRATIIFRVTMPWL